MEDDQDHISQLPDSVLSKILSSLKIREAVGTSVVSKGWRCLWTTPTNLIFDARNMLDEANYSRTKIGHTNSYQRYMIRRNRNFAFIYSVNQYLSQLNEDHRIENFKVCFTFRDNDYRYDLDNWIDFAIKRKVEEIDLCLWEDHPFSAPIEGSLYVFPCDILDNKGASDFESSLKRLRLAHCIIAPNRSNFAGFTRITSLDLNKVDLISTGHIRNLLSNCHKLEWLSFSECRNLVYLKIDNPNCQKLKCLHVNDCHQLKAIQLEGLNIEILEYKGCIVEFLFCNVPRLRTVFSHVSDWTVCDKEIWPLFRLQIDLPQLETLFLECSCYMAGVMAKRFPPFSNIKHMIILKVAIFQQDLSCIASVLKACPTLERMELHIRTYLRTYLYNDIDQEESRKENWPPKCPHNHLKEVLITGLRGFRSEIETAIYVLKNASSLEKMTIDPRPRIYLGDTKWHILDACEGWTTIGRQVFQDLIPEAPPALKLLIL